jgi:DNA-binding IscR family transcriptional regulator
MGTGACDRSGACNVHGIWRMVQERIVDALDGVTIEELARQDR